MNCFRERGHCSEFPEQLFRALTPSLGTADVTRSLTQEQIIMVTLSEIIKRHPTIVDLIEYIKTFKVGDFLPGERDVADAVGWNRATIREHMRSIECLGHVVIKQGKPTQYVKGF